MAGRPVPLCDAHGHPPPRHTAPPSRRPAAEDQPGVLERDGCWTKVGGGAGGTGPQPVPGLCGSGRAAWGPSPVRPLEQPAGGWASPAWGSAPRAWDTPTAPSECGARPGRVPLWGHGLGTSWVPWGVGQGQEIQRTGNTPPPVCWPRASRGDNKACPSGPRDHGCSGHQPAAPQ